MLKTTTAEPQKARFTKDNAIVKDYYFYQGNEFSWNKPAKINDKHYPFFHKQKDEHKKTIEGLQAQEKQDKTDYEEYRKERIIEMKEKTKARYDQRVLERSLIQNKSSQPIKSLPDISDYECEERALDVIARRIDASKHTRTNDISWNHLHKASKKYVDQHLRPICVQREDEMMEHFRKKLSQEKAKEEEDLERRSEKHKSIRLTFLAKHQENLEKQQKLGIAPDFGQELNQNTNYGRVSKDGLPTIQILDNDPSRRYSLMKNAFTTPSLNSVDEGFKIKYPDSLPNLDEPKRRTISSAAISKLAEPRRITPKESSLEYSELKGLLIKNMDDKVYYNGNEFYETLAGYSKNFQTTLKDNRESRKRLTTQGTSRNGRTTAGSKTTINQFSTNEMLSKPSSQASFKRPEKKIVTLPPQRNEIYNEIDIFEKRMPQTRPTGYAKTDLINPAILMAAQKSNV